MRKYPVIGLYSGFKVVSPIRLHKNETCLHSERPANRNKSKTWRYPVSIPSDRFINHPSYVTRCSHQYSYDHYNVARWSQPFQSLYPATNFPSPTSLLDRTSSTSDKIYNCNLASLCRTDFHICMTFNFVALPQNYIYVSDNIANIYQHRLRRNISSHTRDETLF